MVEVTVVLLALVGALVLGYSLGVSHQLELTQELERDLALVQQELALAQQRVVQVKAQLEKDLAWDLSPQLKSLE
jgi:Tfp pilus assembly protein PilO